jgi:hypothetical protein
LRGKERECVVERERFDVLISPAHDAEGFSRAKKIKPVEGGNKTVLWS